MPIIETQNKSSQEVIVSLEKITPEKGALSYEILEEILEISAKPMPQSD